MRRMKTGFSGFIAVVMLVSAGLAAAAQSAPPPAAALATPKQADPAAYALLQEAHDARQVLPANFRGLTADVAFDDNGKQSTGTFTYKPRGKSEVVMVGLAKEPQDWLEDQILSMMGHRSGSSFAQGDGRYPITFGADDHNPWGRLVLLNDGMDSSYRVRDRQIVEVTRSMGDTRFTISVLQMMTTETGKYLSLHFGVSYRDAKTGALQRVEGFRDAYDKLTGTPYGTIYLPSHRIVVSFDSGPTPAGLRTIALNHIKLQ